MNCIKCGQTLDETKLGFVVCPHCHTVNMVGVLEASEPISQYEPLVPAEPQFSANGHEKTKHSKIKRLKKSVIAGVAAGAIIFISAFGFFSYQNAQALSSLNLAKKDIAVGKYDEAASRLSKASKQYVVFGDTKKQLADLTRQDKSWQSAAKKFNQATSLFAQGNLADAKVVIASIPTSFPTYSKVKDLSDKIGQQEAATLASAQAAEAAKAAAAAKAAVKPVTKPVATAAPVKATLGKRFTNVSPYAANLASAKTIAEAQAALQGFVSQYGLTMSITSISPSYYVSSYDTYTILGESDLQVLKNYGSLFIDEWAKYPTDWVANSQLKGIALAKDFAVSGTHRAAAPDPVGDEMYYDPTYTGDYAREVVHHEFDHLFTYNYFNSYSPPDPTWVSYNTPGFTYGNGGASCYLPNNTCLSGAHPIQGFASGYGASAIEEDKAEVYGYLMTGVYYKQMKVWILTDPYLANKLTNYKAFMASHSTSMSGSYFDDINP